MSTRRLVRGILPLALFVVFLAGAGAGELAQEFEAQLQRARGGDVQAMYSVGEMYELGIGTDSSRSKALQWYRDAAEHGHAGGAYQVGYAYYWGKGLPKDRHEAYSWFLRAAEAGNQPAMPYLSKMYALGQGVAQDKAKAAEWASRADTASNLHKPPPAPESPPRPAPAPPIAADHAKPPQAKPSAPQPEVAAQRQATPEPEPVPGTKPAPKPAPRNEPQPKAEPRPAPERVAIERLLAWHWEKDGHPALYLPSSLTECRDNGKHLDCASTPRRSSLLGRAYAFRLIAVIADFDRKGHFSITFRPQVTGVLEAGPGGYGEEGAEAITPEQLHQRVEREPQTLDCLFRTRTQLNCDDALGKPQVFKAVKPKPRAARQSQVINTQPFDSARASAAPPPSPPPQQEAQAESRRIRTVGPPP